MMTSKQIKHEHPGVVTCLWAFGLIVFLSLTLNACSKSPPPPEVSANGEALLGNWSGENDDIAEFRGIPFAAPPLGELRWRAPVAHQPREGVQQTDEFAPACMQGPHIVNWYARVAAAFGQDEDVVGKPNGISEDCLYLNIWSPNLSADAGLPVMVYVHGGSNKGGWSYEPNYLGDGLASRGVVVVSIAYRLGPLGFLSHPSLDNVADQPVSNFGLLDIEQAFMWVQQNIAAFGGDPGNITGFGESAGAGNLVVLALAGTDQEQVFRRIIAQSTGGSADRLISLADQQALGEKLAIGLGAPVDASAQELRALPAQALVDASDTVLDGYYFSPAIDGLTIKTQPLEALRAGHGKDLELMIGTNADEMYMYIDAASGAEELDTWIMDTAPEFAGSLHAALEDETDPRRALDRLQTAKDTLCPSRYTAALVSAQGGQGFVYYFSLARQGEGGELLGAYHGTELPYVFNKHDSWLPTGQDDLALTEVMLDYWASFAATGSPQATNQPGWPVFTDSRKYVMELGSQVSIVEPQDEVLCRYLGPRKQ